MYTFKFRRDTADRWENVNPILAEGEPGVEKDTSRVKIGDGVTPWTELDYFNYQKNPEVTDPSNATLPEHVNSELPHPVYDDGPSLSLLYENAKV